MTGPTLERRHAVRIPATLAVEIRYGKGFSLHSSSDISAGGLFFDRAIPHPLGATVDLSFTLPGDTRAVRCGGQVVNVPDSTSFGMGIRFLDLTPEDEARIKSFITETGP